MPRISVTLYEEQDAILEEKTGADGEYDSKSEAVRSIITEHQRLERENERLSEHVTRLEREKRLILEQREETTDLVRTAERQQDWIEKQAKAGLLAKAKWAIFGMPDDENEKRA